MIMEKHVRRWEREEISARDMVSARNIVGFCGVRPGDKVLALACGGTAGVAEFDFLPATHLPIGAGG